MAESDPVAIEFDFAKREQRVIPLDQAVEACRRGTHIWIDLPLTDRKLADDQLKALGVNRVAIDEALSQEVVGRHDVYDDCLHVSVAAPHLENGELTFRNVDIVIGEQYVVTLRASEIGFLRETQTRFPAFFQKFAKSMGFLLFEIWDHLIDSYRKVFRVLEDQVQEVQATIFGETDDAILNQVAAITRDLLVLRKNVLADREVLHQMSIHKSTFVPETTQPYLLNMVGTLERLGADLAVEREILNDTLTLYLGIVSHQTNRVVNRLTRISLIFLPLTFLCGVYGMNFVHQPEFKWQLGYPMFWMIALATVVGLVWLMWRKRWL